MESTVQISDGDKLTDGYLQHIYLGCLPDSHAELAGKSVTAAAAASSRPAGEWVLDLLAETRLNAGGHLDRPALTDGDLTWIASAGLHCAGSDGIYQGQHPTRAATARSPASPGTTSPTGGQPVKAGP